MYNKVILIGNVGGDPELKHFDSGSSNAKFSLATSEKFKDKSGEMQEKTQWHNCVVWGGLVNVVERFVNRGTKLMVEGKIEYNKYEKDGETKYFTQINVRELKLLGSKGEGAPRPASTPGVDAVDGDEIPF